LDLPVDILHWTLALSPIVALLVLLAVLRWQAPEAAPLGVLLGVLVAILAFQTPWETLAVGAGKGVWDAIFILLVVWPALLLYRVGEQAGAFDALRRGITRFSRDELFLVLAFGWVFASFLQGIAGFGTPIAVVAPLLLALGVRPVYAVVIPLIGHAWANMFGTLAVGWLATLAVIDLEQETLTAVVTAALLWIPNLAAGFTIAWLFGRGPALRRSVPFVLVVTVIHGGGQLLLAFWNPVLSTFLASTVALGALYPLSRWDRYQEDEDFGDEQRPAMDDDRADPSEEDEGDPVMSFTKSLVPYIALTVLSIVFLVPPPVAETLEQVQVGFEFPEVTTGYGVETEAEEYSPFEPLTHPGTFLLLATAIAYAVFRRDGSFEKWKERGDGEGQGGILSSTAEDAVPASVSIVGFLVLAKIMDHSGQTDVLALGIEAVAPAVVYAAVANLIGVVGAFMTSSNTASNVLFSSLQQSVAEAEGLSEAAIIGAQSTGGAIGNAVAPANVVLGTSTAGIVGQEGAVLRKTLPWTMAVAVLVGAATILFLGVGG
jgi:lactate permease